MIFEQELTEQWGIGTKELRKLRKTLDLKREEDFALMAGRIVYNASGLKKLASHLNIPLPQKKQQESLPEAPSEVKTVQDEIIATVAVRYPHNKHILSVFPGELTGEDLVKTPRQNMVRVRVKDTSKFTRGMFLKIRRLQGDLFELVGRVPRWPGKF